MAKTDNIFETGNKELLNGLICNNKIDKKTKAIPIITIYRLLN